MVDMDDVSRFILFKNKGEEKINVLSSVLIVLKSPAEDLDCSI
jgi:hypothetical protein